VLVFGFLDTTTSGLVWIWYSRRKKTWKKFDCREFYTLLLGVFIPFYIRWWRNFERPQALG